MLCALQLSLALLGSAEHFDDPGSDVSGFHRVSQPRTGLVIAGAISFVVGSIYLIGTNINDPLGAIPFIGAFARARDLSEGPATLALVAGVAQIVGASLVLLGLTVHAVWLERDEPPVQLAVGVGPAGARLTLTF